MTHTEAPPKGRTTEACRVLECLERSLAECWPETRLMGAKIDDYGFLVDQILSFHRYKPVHTPRHAIHNELLAVPLMGSYRRQIVDEVRRIRTKWMANWGINSEIPPAYL